MRRPDLEHAASQNHAVRAYARSVRDIDRMEELNLPVLPHQQQAHERARAALEAVRPKGARDLDSAFAANKALVGEAAEGRTREAIRAMQAEAEIRTNPALRADRFVARWQDLELKREGFHRSGDMGAARSIKATMGEMAKGLERDAQVESLLRNRSKELGIPMDMGRSPGHSMMDYLGLGRSRGLSL